MKVKILQGPSGAGKSTYTKNLPGKVYVCSADDFFMNNGQYVFDHTKLSKAHSWCLRKFLEIVGPQADDDPNNYDGWTVVVDNTNTTATEIAPYYQTAVAYGHDVEIVTFNVDAEVAWGRNVHKVPAGTVKSQVARIKQSHSHFPKHWKHTIVSQ